MDLREPTKLDKHQLDLLALFERTDLLEEDWTALRRPITRVFAERASDRADAVADEKGWTEEDFERMARRHLRHGTRGTTPRLTREESSSRTG